jgi:hypothetical protein
MTTPEIKAVLAFRAITVRALATAIEEDYTAVSQTICYLRENKRLRKKIADYLLIPAEVLFDEMPTPASQRPALAAS